MKEKNWQYLVGAVWIVFALISTGVGVLEDDLWLATMNAVVSIAMTLLGSAYFWHDRFTVFQ